jgi:hypothetical protein
MLKSLARIFSKFDLIRSSGNLENGGVGYEYHLIGNGSAIFIDFPNGNSILVDNGNLSDCK